MSTPYQRAAELHNASGMALSFREAVEAHAICGYVFATPELFLLGRRVGSDWTDDELCDPWLVAPDGDVWHVFLAAGDLREGLRLLPYRLPWLSYYHDGKHRLMRLSSFEKRSRLGSIGNHERPEMHPLAWR